MYLIRSGCQWRLLPPCYPHWKSVYNKWRYWNATGLFDKIHSFTMTPVLDLRRRNVHALIASGML